MMRASRVGTVALLARHAGTGLVGSLLVAVLVGCAVFATALAPRVLARLSTQELQHVMSEMSPLSRDLRGLGSIGLPFGLAGEPAERLLEPTDATIARFRDNLPEPLRKVTGRPSWVARTASRDAALPQESTPVRFAAKLAVDPRWRERIRIVSGVAPAVWASGDEDDDVPDPSLEVAVSVRTAAELGIGAGTRVSYGPLDLTVTGVYEPIDPADPYWVHVSDLDEPSIETDPGAPRTVRASMYVDARSLGGLTSSMTDGTLIAWLPIDPGALVAADAPTVLAQLRSALAGRIALPYDGGLSFRSLTPDAIESALDRTVAVTALLALDASGVFGVLLAVFTLGIATLVRGRRPALVLAYARGASTAQVRGAMAVQGVVLAVPATALGLAAAAVLVPEPVGTSGWMLPLAVGASVPVLFALLSGPRSVTQQREDLRMRTGSGSRVVAELAVAGLAIVSVALLARRGIDASSRAVGVDPLLILAPLLLAGGVCLGGLRLYPLPLHLLLRRLRSSNTAVGLLGAARAIRAPVFGFSASLALVLGVSVVIFSSILGSTVRDAIVSGSRERVGADILVSAPDLPPGLVAEVGRLPGVAAAAALASIPGVRVNEAGARTAVTLLAADTRALHAVRSDIPVLATRVGDAIPLVVSRDIVGLIGTGAQVAGASVTVTGSLSDSALPIPPGDWALVDERFLVELGSRLFEPGQMLVRLAPKADAGALRTEIDRTVSTAQPDDTGGSVSTVSARELLDEVRASPLTRGLEAALPWIAAAALVLTLLGVALATVAAAGARSRTIAVLRILGADARQQRSVLLWEYAPPVIASVVVGMIVGFALPVLLTRIVDLRSFAGGRMPPDPVVDPAGVALAAGAVVIVAIGAGAVALVTARRLAPASTLRIGER